MREGQRALRHCPPNPSNYEWLGFICGAGRSEFIGWNDRVLEFHVKH